MTVTVENSLKKLRTSYIDILYIHWWDWDTSIKEVMDMMTSGRLAGYEQMVTGRIDLADIVAKGFEELIHNKDRHVKILVKPR